MINYMTAKPTQDGVYLVLCDGKLEVAEATMYADGEAAWAQINADYDIWNASEEEFDIAIVCKLDLEQIAASAQEIHEAADERKIVAIFDIHPGFANSPVQYFHDVLVGRVNESPSLTVANVSDTIAVRDQVTGRL